MRKLSLPFVLLLAGCAAAQPPLHGETPGHRCRQEGGERFVGATASSETAAAILAATGASTLRWAPPGAALTMDYRFDRVTVYLDARNRIERVSCG